MLEHKLITYAAPTLAGLKCANLFTYKKNNRDLNEQIDSWSKVLNRKNIYIEILAENDKKALIYVYINHMVFKEINNTQKRNFLKDLGYDTLNLKQSISHLKERISFDCFPHEIGLFLGYPFEDVMGFIKNCGDNYIHSGYWKVYSNKNETIRIFNRYNKVRRSYQILYDKGFNIEYLSIKA